MAAFCYNTTESLPVGLLQVMAADLGTSLSAVGLLVTAYAVVVAVVSVPLTRMTARVSRRRLLIGLLSVFVVTTWVSVAAPNYWLLLAARLVMALSQAVFWPVSVVAAAGLFPARVRGRAATVVFSGGSLAIVLGVPSGTWLGQQAGWRMSFLALGGLGLLALAAIALLLPPGAPGEGHTAASDTPDARRFRLLVATIMLAVTGYFTFYTYVTPFLSHVSGFSAAAISPLLLVFGVMDFAGITAAGAVVDRGARATMIAAIALLTAALLGVYTFGPHPVAAIGLFGLVGFAFPAMVPGMQLRVLQVAPGNTDVASAGVSAAFNVGIASGALAGALLLPAAGVRSTALAGALLTATALAVTLSERLRPIRLQAKAEQDL
ncbi:MAG TPA: MFS transporter [Streptosporangiaceae bacterium]